MSKNNNVGRLSFSTTVVTRFFSLCAVLLVLPAVEAAQFLPPGWYRNSGPSTFYQGEHLTVAPQLTVVMLPLPFPVVVSAWMDVLGVWVQPKGAGGP
jgi:hypothetical protein